MARPFDPTLCLVLGPADVGRRDPCEVAAAAIRGGVTLVQLRWKHAPEADIRALAARLRAVTAPAGVPLILNDRPELVAEAGADGVHVGQADMPAVEARRRLGPDAILGLSIETLAQAAALDPAGIDYVGLGPVFATGSKPDHAVPLGISGFAEARTVLEIPVIAIGGMSAENAAAMRAAGADGLAVISAICGAPDPEAAARRLVARFGHGRDGGASA
ncbi:thiamine phosphate synthase [Propylenella binzhouense]|uniref:Thiamine-phosphate synthase n=1 Tax=Propylenella binzhouense TaxID=2555902 RepID=A0A964T3Q3_9HYPH|nr:thiamine phosphate synthase [Propylenella binzhouense]